ncbi:MAG TPA: DUF1648 domain-containing protein [Candidatus Corynebacterium avicola]|uniref:DUF1648 domain-containing protein n=1 Tax=Candidatus Corynebacterium avicola TaxID=2838527 RepID=A0A9D1RPN0_9CORY|nr:DUF1648 domain-containing protein [Candidatus Corynebacterium avicola]
MWKPPPRPERTYTTGPVTVWLRRLTLAATALITVAVLIAFPGMPDTIPVHFDGSGEADDWGSKVTILLLSALMVAMIVGVDWCSRRSGSDWFNYPKAVTEDNAQRMYRAGEQLMVWLNAGMVVLYLAMVASMTEFTTAPLIIPGMVIVFGAVIVGLVKTVRA